MALSFTLSKPKQKGNTISVKVKSKGFVGTLAYPSFMSRSEIVSSAVNKIKAYKEAYNASNVNGKEQSRKLKAYKKNTAAKQQVESAK